MKGLDELRAPRIRGDLPRPEIVVKPRFDVAAQLGVSVESISQTIRIATLGDLPQNGAKFSLTDRQIPIRVSLTEHARRDMSTLENLPVPTTAGTAVPLKSVADLSFGQGPSAVRRYNQSRRLFLEADLSPGVELGTATQKIYALPTMAHLPQGVHLIKTGNTENFQEMRQNFALAIGAGVLMVLAVLVLLFARLFQPITILSALPLSLGGAALALLLTNRPFSIAVVIGFLMLMGIVAKNSILLVDFAIEEMRSGKPRFEAILESGHKRARPIVMTTVAMVAGMLPVAVGLGGDSAFRSPMAIAVIGGLVTSTLLTLVIVPAVFTLFDDLERWIAPKAGRLLAEPVGSPEGRLAAPRPAAPPRAGTERGQTAGPWCRRCARRHLNPSSLLRPGLWMAALLAAAPAAHADLAGSVNWARQRGCHRAGTHRRRYGGAAAHQCGARGRPHSRWRRDSPRMRRWRRPATSPRNRWRCMSRVHPAMTMWFECSWPRTAVRSAIRTSRKWACAAAAPTCGWYWPPRCSWPTPAGSSSRSSHW